MNALTPFENAASARRAGQGTMVEQSRAVAEVQAAVVVAQQRPRDKARAIGEMREVCKIKGLADKAFFRFSRGGSQVTGPSIHLARELARCWGNIDFGVKELARDDDRGQSEMLAFAWCLETNTRNETTFIVPHKRDVKGGQKVLTDMRDIYENNANNGARRLRECIFGVLPVWFTEDAKDVCTATLQDGGGVPLLKRIADCLQRYEEIGVSKAQIEKKMGRPADQMIAEDVAQLGVIFKSIRRGEINRDEEFPRDEAEARQLPPGADGFEQAAAGAKPVEERAAAKVEAKPQDNHQGDDTGDWALLDASAWLARVYELSDMIDASTSPKALSVMQAAPKFADPYAAMAKHAPASKETVDKMIADRRKALS